MGAKAAFQHHGIWFARHGFAALVLDTIEFGEIPGIHHGIHDLGMWHWLSLGYTPAGVEVWNAIRALDYLETRKEVDTSRAGITGISGEGRSRGSRPPRTNGFRRRRRCWRPGPSGLTWQAML